MATASAFDQGDCHSSAGEATNGLESAIGPALRWVPPPSVEHTPVGQRDACAVHNSGMDREPLQPDLVGDAPQQQ